MLEVNYFSAYQDAGAGEARAKVASFMLTAQQNANHAISEIQESEPIYVDGYFNPSITTIADLTSMETGGSTITPMFAEPFYAPEDSDWDGLSIGGSL